MGLFLIVNGHMFIHIALLLPRGTSTAHALSVLGTALNCAMPTLTIVFFHRMPRPHTIIRTGAAFYRSSEATTRQQPAIYIVVAESVHLGFAEITCQSQDTLEVSIPITKARHPHPSVYTGL